MRKITVGIILAFILMVGLFLRSYNYTVWPREGATFDEFAWTFLGLSLWEKGVPSSWSPHKAYKNRVEYFNPQGAHFTIVTPYLEHPPLFGLIAGGFARLRGITTFDEVRVATVRPLAIALGILSIYMVFLLASVLYGDVVGLIASAVYAITPTVAVGSRLVQNENFFIPFFLLSLLLAYRNIQRPKKGTLAASVLIASILPLAKVPWVAAPIAVAGIFAISRKWKEAGLVLLATTLIFSIFLVYGFVLDREVFINLWKLQLARYDMVFDSLFILFRDPVVVDRALVDGWIYFGWVAMILLLVKDIKKHLPVVIGFLAYGAIFVFAIPSEGLHGWYRYPFYPFLAIATAVFIKEYLNVNYLVTAVFYVVVGLSMFAESWGRTYGFSYPVFRIYLMTVACSALPVIFPKLQNKRAFRWLHGVMVLCIIFLSCWAILLYNEQ